MSYPFGGHPTLERFIEWACQHGCTLENKVRSRSSGEAYELMIIRNGDGARVVIAKPDMAERLAPSQVAYLQRRLAIKTPFASTPEPPAS